MRKLTMATLACILLGGSVASAQNLEASNREFRNYCASCHGIDGRGGGFLVGLFPGMKLPDLTQLTKNNGGRFPFNRILETIDGRNAVAAHGDRVMPVWGDRYKAETQDVYGPYGNEYLVRMRVLELVYYIQSKQVE